MKGSFLFLSLSLWYAHQGMTYISHSSRPCALKPKKCSLNYCPLFSWLLSYTKHCTSGGEQREYSDMLQDMIFYKMLHLLFCFFPPFLLSALPICFPPWTLYLFISHRVTLRLGGNRRSTVRHILRGVSRIDLMIYAISKHSGRRHSCRLLPFHTCSSKMHWAHECI